MKLVVVKNKDYVPYEKEERTVYLSLETKTVDCELVYCSECCFNKDNASCVRVYEYVANIAINIAKDLND